MRSLTTVLLCLVSLSACSPPPVEAIEETSHAVYLPPGFAVCPQNSGAACRQPVPAAGTLTLHMGATLGGHVYPSLDAYTVDVAHAPNGRITIDDLSSYGLADPAYHVIQVTGNLGNFSEWFNLRNRVAPSNSLCQWLTCYYRAIFQTQAWVVHNEWPTAVWPFSFYATNN